MDAEPLYVDALGRIVFLRPGTSDAQVCADTFGGAGGYHVPPDAGTIRPRVVLDLGANIGLTAAHYQRIWPSSTVYAVEPVIESLELAARNAPEAYVQWLAVTDWNGLGEYDPDARAEAVQVRRVDDDHGHPTFVQVQCSTLSTWISNNQTVDFCKMDVEGAEWGILRQADRWAGRVERLLVELHDVEGAEHGEPLDGRDGPNELVGGAVSLLRAAGYEARPHVAHPQAVWAWR